LRALENPASYGRVFNLGSGRETSINRLADLALAALGRSRRDHPVYSAPARPGELRRVSADVSRARAVLGWEPRPSFADGPAAPVRWGGGEAGARAAQPLPAGARSVS